MAVSNEVDQVLDQLAIALAGGLGIEVVGIALYSPDGPQGYVGQFQTVEMLVERAVAHPVVEGALCGIHDELEVLAVVYRQGAARQSDELVTGADLEPGIAGQQVVTLLVGDVELLGAVLHAVIEARARCARLDLVFIHLGERAGVHLLDTCREDEGLALLDLDLEVAGHVQVLAVGDAALLVLGVLDVLVPVRVKHEAGLVVHLHVQGGIAVVHAGGDTVGHLLVVAAGDCIFHAQVIGVAEGQEGPELQRRCRVGIHQRVTDEDAVLVGDKDLLFLEDDAAHAIGGGGHAFAVILADVLVAVGAVGVTLVAVQSQVERRTVLDDGLVERGQQHMVVVVELGNRDDQQAMLLAGVAANDGGAVVGSRLVGSQHLFGQ